MELINLTPHDVVLVSSTGERVVLAPAGSVARLATLSDDAGELCGVPLAQVRYGPVSGLPAPRRGRTLVVSTLVAERCRDRPDLVAPDTSPGSAVRDVSGRIVAVRRLACFREATVRH